MSAYCDQPARYLYPANKLDYPNLRPDRSTMLIQFTPLLTTLSVALLLSACQPQDTPLTQSPQGLAGAAKVWDRTLGGDKADVLRTLVTTPDGGYLVAGNSSSSRSGDKSQPRNGPSDIDNDYWVVKLAPDGGKQWDKTFGRNGSGTDLHSAVVARDGSYLLGGVISSATGDRNFWVVKLAPDGTKQWDKTVGTPGWEDHLYGMVATADGGFLIGGSGYSNASGDKSEDNRGDWGSSDYWIIKLGADGTKQWDRTFGGSGSEDLKTILATPDGGYLLGGTSTSPASGDKTQASWGGGDYWVVKISQDGQKQWDKTLGGGSLDKLQAMVRSADGGFLLAGYSESKQSGEKSQTPRGYYDYWVVKLTGDGRKQWDHSYDAEEPYIVSYEVTLAPTADNGFLLGGGAHRMSATSQGPAQYWLSRYTSEGSKQWEKVFTTSKPAGGEEVGSIVPALDGGFVLGGTSGASASGDKSEDSRGYLDYWLVKIN